MNGQYTRRKVFDLTRYSGNAHQNRGEMPPYTHSPVLLVKKQKTAAWTRRWEAGAPVPGGGGGAV